MRRSRIRRYRSDGIGWWKVSRAVTRKPGKLSPLLGLASWSYKVEAVDQIMHQEKRWGANEPSGYRER